MTDHYWCSSCERAFLQDNPDMCTYEDCTGRRNAIFRWEDFKKQASKAPDIPKLRVIYKLDDFVHDLGTI